MAVSHFTQFEVEDDAEKVATVPLSEAREGGLARPKCVQ